MRFVALDSWRGLAALLIAALHFNVATHGYDAAIWRFAPLAVDFFFVLSGYVITAAYGSRLSEPRLAAAFMVRRFGRLWPLHATVLACFVALELAKLGAVAAGLPARTPPFAAGSQTALDALPLHIFLLNGTGLADRLSWNGPSWSISAEFWVYIVFAAACLLFKRRATIVLSCLGVLSAVVLVRAIGAHDLDLTYDYGLVRCLLGFSIGHGVWWIQNRFALRPPGTATQREILVLAAVAGGWFATRGTPAVVVMPLLFGLLVGAFSEDRGRICGVLKAAPFQALGRWSYSIYMVHGFVIYLMTQVATLSEAKTGWPAWQPLAHGGRTVRTIVMESPWSADAALIAYLAIVVAMSALTFRFVEAPARAAFNIRAERIARRPVRTVGLA